MRIFFLLLLISLGTLLTSCGGGGGSSSAEAKLSLNLDFDNARVDSTGFYISNTEIGSVSLEYTNSAGEGGSLDITSLVTAGVVEVTELTIETTYTFNIAAYGADGTEVCSGAANIYITPDVVNQVNLVCSFQETLAMENAVYDFVASAIANGGSLTAAQIDRFVATDFGVMNGMSRTEFIADMAAGDLFEFTDTGITLVKVDVIDPTSRAAGTETFVDFYFSDGSIIREEIWMVEENGEWLLSGNGREYEIELLAEAFHIIDSSGATSTYTGIQTYLSDASGEVVEASITGTGLSSEYLFEPATCTDCDSLVIFSPYNTYSSYSLTDHFMVLSDLMTASTELYNDPVYTLTSTYSDSTTTTDTIKVYGSPVPLSALTAGHFVSIAGTPSQDPNDYASSPVTFTIVRPTAYDARYIDVHFSFNGANGEHLDSEGIVPSNTETFTLDFTSIDFMPTDAELHMTAFDDEGKAFTTAVLFDFVHGGGSSYLSNAFYRSGYSMYNNDGIYFDDGSVLMCGSAIMDYNDTGVSAATFATTTGDAMTKCEGLANIDNGSSANDGYTYFVGSSATDHIIVNYFDNTGSIVWSKSYSDSVADASLYVVDTAIINTDHLLILVQDLDNIYLLELDINGNIIAQKEVRLDGMLAAYKILPKTLSVSPSGAIVISGNYYDGYMTNTQHAVFVVTDSSYSSFAAYSAQYYDVAGSSFVPSSFESAAFTLGGDIIFSGYAVEYSYGDLVISRYDTTESKFYSVVYNNHLVNSMAITGTRVHADNTGLSFYLTANEMYNSLDIMKFTFSASSPTMIWQKNMMDSSIMPEVHAIQTDSSDNLILFGRILYTIDPPDAMLGVISYDGFMPGATLTDGFGYSIRTSPQDIASTIIIATGATSTIIFQEELADADNYLSPITVDKVEYLPLDGLAPTQPLD
ncbi:MAG: hypothetical protein C0603_00095 [Denitrovibrio sp.]|nr:MAG: hypothetical protein C0603_00095 [Denitrovibrio sp.]